MKLFLLKLLAIIARLCARPATPGPPRRVLVLKPDHLGDLLLAAPALRALRGAAPGAQITALVGPWSRRIWAGCPDLDALVDLPFPGFDRGGAPALSGRLARTPYILLLKYALLLRAGRYDAALLLRDDHWWGATLIALAGIPRRIGHAHPLCAPMLTDALPYDPREHVARQALAVVGRLAEGRHRGVSQAPPAPLSASSPRLSAPWLPAPADHIWAAGWLAEHLAPGERLVVIHPGTGGPTKHWPPEGWAAVGRALAGRPGLRPLLTGGPGEGELVAQVAAQIGPAPLTLAGKTSVGQLAALLGRAALVLGVDSGPLHIAVSQGAPTIHLYGPSDHRRFGPWGDPARQIVLRADLPCSPCGIFSACPRHTAGPECMALITPQAVIAAAERLL